MNLHLRRASGRKQEAGRLLGGLKNRDAADFLARTCNVNTSYLIIAWKMMVLFAWSKLFMQSSNQLQSATSTTAWPHDPMTPCPSPHDPNDLGRVSIPLGCILEDAVVTRHFGCDSVVSVLQEPVCRTRLICPFPACSAGRRGFNSFRTEAGESSLLNVTLSNRIHWSSQWKVTLTVTLWRFTDVLLRLWRFYM